MIKLQIALYAMLGTIALLNPAAAQSAAMAWVLIVVWRLC
jgi:hypothetical protein